MEDKILKQILRINGSTHGVRHDQVEMVKKIMEQGILTKEDLRNTIEIIKDLPFPNDQNSELWDTLFSDERYYQAALKLMPLFSKGDTWEIVSVFLNIFKSPIHNKMSIEYYDSISSKQLTEIEAQYVMLAFILADFRVNLREERTGYY